MRIEIFHETSLMLRSYAYASRVLEGMLPTDGYEAGNPIGVATWCSESRAMEFCLHYPQRK